jgi:hypothetical protein
MRRAKLGLPSNYSITCVDEWSQAIDKTVSRALMIVSSCVSICSIWTYPAFACQSSALWTLFRLALDPYSFLRHYNNRQLRQIEKKFLYWECDASAAPYDYFSLQLAFCIQPCKFMFKSTVALCTYLRKSANCCFINT